jgi:hypothetical protein
LVSGWCAAAAAQYQTNPTDRFPLSSNPPPSQKSPPNKAVSVQDRHKKGILLNKPDRYYPINQTKPIALSPSNHLARPVTVWKNVKKVGYPSLYQDPSK